MRIYIEMFTLPAQNAQANTAMQLESRRKIIFIADVHYDKMWHQQLKTCLWNVITVYFSCALSVMAFIGEMSILKNARVV